MTIPATTPSPSAVVDMLNARPRTIAQPVRVTIGRTTYPGAIYSQQRDVTPGCRAYADGQRTYYSSGLYLLGDAPSSYRHRHARAYLDSAGARWYVAGYVTDETAADPRYSDYHPMGAHFMLARDSSDVTLTGVYGQPVADRTMPMALELLTAIGAPISGVEHVSRAPVSGIVECMHAAGAFIRTPDGRSVYVDGSDGWTVELLPELKEQV